MHPPQKPTWNLNGLILEGISGSGKTSVLKRLLAHDAWITKPFTSSLVLSEHHTQRVLEAKERNEGLHVNDHLMLLANILDFVEQIHKHAGQMDWAERQKHNHKLPYLLERFHFTHVYHYPYMTWNKVDTIEHRLLNLNAKVCVLTIDKVAIEQRIFGDRNKQWASYLQRYGSTKKRIINHFTTQQQQLFRLCELTRLPILVIDTSTQTINEIVEKILTFWGITEI